MSEISREAALAHFGVKGMKWGVRNPDRPSSAQVGAAQRKMQTKANKYHDQRAKTKAAPKGSAARKKGEAKLAEMKKDFLKDPDRVTAMRMTNGERVANGILAVAFPVAGTAAVAGYTAGSVAARKVVSSRQRRGYYDR